MMSPRRRIGFVVAALAAVFVAVQSGATTTHAAGGPTWWKVDLHEHSAFSGDARADIGIDAAKAKAQSYNAVFLTDHDRGSGFQIAGDNGNKISAPEKLNGNWSVKLLPSPLPSGGSGIAPTAVQAPSPVHAGTYSLHVNAKSASSTTVRSVAYDPRGMGLRSGAVTLDFWAYPKTTSSTAGLDVSVALGGDKTAGPTPFGYTTSDGVAHVGKSTMLVWQIGGARPSSADGTTDVVSNSLSFAANKWNHYVINVGTGQVQWTPLGGSTAVLPNMKGLNALGADAPADYAVLSYVKMEAAATNSTADGYFDDFKMSVASPQCTSTEFVYRNSLLSALAVPGQFMVFPAREMGQNNHANQFNFGINNVSQYKDTFTDTTQDDNAICAPVNNPSAQWQFSKLGTDNISGVQASGYPAQDNHPGVTDSVADVVQFDAYGADAVEARTGQDYSNPSDLPSGDAWDQILMKNVVIMGTQGSDAHEGPGTTTPSMFVDAPALTLNSLMHSYFEGRMYGAPGNFKGRVVFNLDGSPSPYPARYPVYVPSTQTTANVNLAITGGIGSSQQVRWIYSNAGATLSVTDLAPGASSYNATRSIPLSGAYTYVRAAVITPGSTAPTAVNTEPIFFQSVSGMPSGMSVHVDSITPPANTCSCTIALTKGITSTAYGSSTLTLGLNDPAGSGVQILVQSPQAPSGVRVDGSSVSPAASLSSYQGGTGTSWFYDSSWHVLYLRDLQASTISTVAVAYSGGGGGGGGGGTTVQFAPRADSYIDSSTPSTNFGNNAKLRVDTSPTVNSYLQFNVTGLAGTVTGVTLRVLATSNLTAGFDVRASSNHTWGELAITSANAPAPGALLATSGAATLNNWVTINLPPSAVTGNGLVDFVLVGRSATALSLASRESATPPQLSITTS